MSQSPPTLEYRGSDPPPAPRFPTRWTTAVCAAAFAIHAVAFITVVKFQDLWKDFKVELPGATKLLLLMSRFIVDDFGWIVLWSVAGVFIGGAAFVTHRFPGVVSVKAERWWSRSAWFLIIAFILLAILSVMIPMVTIIETMSGKGSKP